MRMRMVISLFAAAFATVASGAAEVAAVDPTVPADAMADALKQQLTGAAGMRLHALVVGAAGEGVALVGADVANAVAVRRGSVIAQTVSGVKVDVTIRKVSALGVELETSNEQKPVFIPGSFTPVAMPTNPPPEFISYLESDKVPISRLMRLIADQTGVNIAFTDSTAARTVSVFLRNVTADAAVEEICRSAGFWYRREAGGNVIRISTMKEYEENLNTFREESTHVFTLLYPNVIEVAGVIYGLYPDRTLLSLGEEEFDKDDEYDLSRRFRRFRLVEENGNSSFMAMKAPQTTSSSSSSSSTFSYTRGSALSRMTQWDQLLNRNRSGASSRANLSSVEAKFIDDAEVAGDTNLVSFALSKAALGAANIFLTISRKNNKLIARTSDSKVMDEIKAIVKEMDVPTPMVLLEVKILELDVSDNYNAGIKWSVLNPEAEDNSVRIGSGENYRFITKTLAGAQAAFNPTFAFTLLSDSIKSEIELMQKDGKAKTLATPTLLVANNEVSRIFSGKRYPLVSGWTKGETVTSLSGSVLSPATVQIEKKDVGTMLLITPNINADKTVTIRLLQENSEVAAGKVDIPVDGGSGDTKQIEYVESRSISGTFVAKDDMTIMAGGLIREHEENVYWRTPVLGSVPLLGWLFRGTDKVKKRTELVVLIKPHVITTPIEGGKISDDVLKALSAHPASDGRETIGIFNEEGEDNEPRTHSVSDDLRNMVK